MKYHKQSIQALNPESVDNVRQEMPDQVLLLLVADCFKALGDPTRAKILYALRSQSLCVRDLAVLVGVSESAMSHQLRILRDKRLVTVERDGNSKSYSIAYEHISLLLDEAESYADHVRQNLPDHSHHRAGKKWRQGHQETVQ